MYVINLELDRVVEEGGKVEQILKDTLLSIPSPSPSVKIQIMSGKVGSRHKGKTLLGVQFFAFTPFPPIICICTEGEGDGIESRQTS